MYVQPKFIPVNILNIQITTSKNIPPHRREVFVGGDDNESFDSSRFVSIRQHFQTPYRRHLRLLQIDFRYAFPCHKRWFLRLPVSHHHWAANRPPVWRFVNCLWRFAAVWVYWTTLTAWRRFLTFKPYGCDRETSFASYAVGRMN